MGYLIKRNDKKNDLVYFNYSVEGYIFSPHLANKPFISIKKIEIVNPNMIDKILTIKFNKLYKMLTYKTYLILQDEDASDSDVAVVLDEIEKFRSIVLHKYQKFLTKEKEELFLKRIRYLENELRSKKVFNEDYEEEYHKGRSR